jgi:hypothetical protein
MPRHFAGCHPRHILFRSRIVGAYPLEQPERDAPFVIELPGGDLLPQPVHASARRSRATEVSGKRDDPFPECFHDQPLLMVAVTGGPLSGLSCPFFSSSAIAASTQMKTTDPHRTA